MLTLCRLRFHLVSHGLRLDSPGNLLHSGIGMMLRRESETAFAACFAEQREGSWPRPYVLLPPPAGRRLYAPGDAFTLELTLFGEAWRWAEAFRGAIARLGEAGVGPDRGGFQLARIEGVDAAGVAALWDPQSGWRMDPLRVDVGQILNADRVPAEASALELEWITPLRLKAEGGLWREAPPLATLTARLLARLAQLSGAPLERRLAAQLDEVARLCRILEDGTRWTEWKRRSVRQQRTMPIGGLLGSVHYGGPVAPLIPWLRLGEWVHLGAKTAFGLGAPRLAVG